MIAGLGILVATTVVAAIYGPFLVGNYFPGVSYEDDRAVENAYTSNIPRNVMNLNVAKIKYGDIVRMVFPSGDIYDYEVAVAKCLAFSSLSCGTYSKATKVSIIVLPENKIRSSEILSSFKFSFEFTH